MLDQFFSSLSFVDIFNFCVFLVFSVCYVYQIFYVFVTLTKKPPQLTAKKNHRYAVIVAARNENAVIGDLIHSIRVQNYPQELIDIFVVADNCTDNTAAVAQEAGAIVFPRFNKEHIGKGYALDYGFSCIRQHYSENEYEAYFVFDADNVLDVNYFREMNKTFDNGAVASTSYRNSKNYGSNWITAGYAVWFMREAKYLSQARLTLGTSCAVSGTGFFISAKIIDEMGGWKYHMLTEDIEFSTASIVRGRRISYTPTAMLYDEQPLTFRDSWNQRFRWAKGFYQVFFTYGKHLVKSTFRYHRFAAYDMFMTIAPGMLLSLISMLANATFLIVGGLSHGFLATEVEMQACAASLILTFAMMYQTFFILALLTTIFEYKHIHCAQKWRLVTNLFTFPIFMFSYIPITVAALFLKVDWVPTQHAVSVTLDEVMQGAK